MEININTKAAWTPTLGMPISGHYFSAVLRAHGVDVVDAKTAFKARRNGDFWVSDAWRPLTS